MTILNLVPDSNITVPSSGFNGGYADIADPSDSNLIYWNNGTTFEAYRCHLTPPPNDNGPRINTAYLRSRLSKTNNGTPVSTTNNQISCQIRLYQTTTLRFDSGVFVAPANTGVWTDVTGTVDLSAVTSYANLQVQIDVTRTGSGGATRGLGITSLFLEVDWLGLQDNYFLAGI